MPYKSEKIRLNEHQDRRRKLTDAQREEIRQIYAKGGIGTGTLAKQYGVSKSTVQVIVNPKIAERHRQRMREHWRDYRPSKEEWAATMREHRHYKHDLYVKGELDNN
jgi:hypothetical protein